MNARLPNFLPRPTGEFQLEPGLVLRAGTTVFSVDTLKDGVAILQHAVSLQRKTMQVSKLLSQIVSGAIVVGETDAQARALKGDLFEVEDQIVLDRLPFDDLSEAQVAHVLKVMRYMKAMRELGHASLSPHSKLVQLDLNRLAPKLGDAEPVKAAWLYNWALKVDRAEGDPRAAIPAFPNRGGRGKSRVDPLVQGAIERVLHDRKNDATLKLRTVDLVNDAKRILCVEHPNRPDLAVGINWSSVDRRKQEMFSAYDICLRNEGKAVANKKYREWYPRDKAEFPLEVFETDDTDSCLFLIDDRSGLPWGRGWITGVIDQYSQVMPGLELSEQSRSIWSAISALMHAFLPKDLDSPDMALVTSEAEFYGKPGIVVFDNALYNHATEIELASASYNITPAWAKPKTPTEKSGIERWNGRVKRECIAQLPGFRGDKKLREGLSEGMASATLSMQELRAGLFQWVYDQYANTPQVGGLTGRQTWHTGTRLAKQRLPKDTRGMCLVPCLHGALRLRPEGLNFQGIIYSAPQLQTARKRYGHNAEIKFRYNPGNLDQIFFFDEDLSVYIPVPATNPEYAKGLTLQQHKLIKKLARENRVKNPAIPQLLLYRDQLRHTTQQLVRSKKLIERRIGNRTGDLPENHPQEKPEKEPNTIVRIMTELEDAVMQIDLIELDLDEEGWVLA